MTIASFMEHLSELVHGPTESGRAIHATGVAAGFKGPGKNEPKPRRWISART